ncbi:unnamed protein product [Linum tenue]|uniref:Uncharacterized protein n=1 Tax=Linum tenue TaxID=586396 RepID=A0AAV0S4Z1_9ROSI|nr:unnamed protein product [Linum tenue]
MSNPGRRKIPIRKIPNKNRLQAGDGGPKNAQLAQILTQLELVGQAMKAQQNCWTIYPIDELGLDGLVQLRNDLEELKLNIVKQQQHGSCCYEP